MISHLKGELKKSMDKAIEGLLRELGKIRTGKAHTSMLDSVRVSYYGTMTPLSQVSALSCPDAKSFLISPWEVSLLKEIESAIVKSDLGMSPINDGKVIRLKLPDLTEERRKGLVKLVKETVESARVAIRLIRRDANEELKNALKEKVISEDDSQRAMDEIQKTTDQFIAKVDQISGDKEKDIMTV